VLDNASIHQAVENRRDEWAACGVILHFLPSYSSELNLIEILGEKSSTSGLSPVIMPIIER